MTAAPFIDISPTRSSAAATAAMRITVKLPQAAGYASAHATCLWAGG
jgi:hypothetical protein